MFNGKLRDQLQEVIHRLEILETYLTVRDPGTAKSADAYDGLRKMLIQIHRGGQAQLGALTDLDRVLTISDDVDVARIKSAQALEQLGVHRVNSVEQPDLYEITNNDDGPLRVDTPAYVDIVNGHVIMRGMAHYESKEGGSSPAHAEEPPQHEDEQGLDTDRASKSTREVGDMDRNIDEDEVLEEAQVKDDTEREAHQ